MRVLTSLLALLVLAQPAFAGSGWFFSRVSDAQGDICRAAVQQNGVTIGFYAAPQGEIAAFVQGVNLPPSSYATWQVGGYQWQRVEGGSARYTNALAYWGVTPQLLAQVAVGNRLDVFLHASGFAGNAPLLGTNDINLRGSARALRQFEQCRSYVAPVVVAQPVVVVAQPVMVAAPVAPAASPNLDTLIGYAMIIGRSSACAYDTAQPQAQVLRWLDRNFARRERDGARAIYAEAVAAQANLQRRGETPEPCGTVVAVAATTEWP